MTDKPKRPRRAKKPSERGIEIRTSNIEAENLTIDNTMAEFEERARKAKDKPPASIGVERGRDGAQANRQRQDRG